MIGVSVPVFQDRRFRLDSHSRTGAIVARMSTPTSAEPADSGEPLAPSVRGLRGATTFDVDEAAHVTDRTNALLVAMMERNELVEEDVVSILFTATADLTSVFPATAARQLGFSEVPLICAQELEIVGSKPQCIRILMHITTPRSRAQLNHVYLEGAADLRDDVGD